MIQKSGVPYEKIFESFFIEKVYNVRIFSHCPAKTDKKYVYPCQTGTTGRGNRSAKSKFLFYYEFRAFSQQMDL